MDRLKRLFSFSCFTNTNDTDSTSSPPIKPIAKFASRPRSTEKNSTTLIISHGAFSTQTHYTRFLSAITKCTTIDKALCPQQSSSSATPPPNSFQSDISLLHSTILNELIAGNDVLLVCHSYGGIPGCEALADLPEKPPKGNNKLGRILGIVFVSAFVAEAGQSLVSALPGPPAAWVRIDGALSYAEDPAKNIFNLIINPSTYLTSLINALVPQATDSFLATTSHASWKDFPCVYVRDLQDKAMTLEQQDAFIARLRGGNSRVKVKEFEGDHVPFASRPEELTRLVEGVVGELRGECEK